jgi:hypothetical protein
MNKFIQMGDTKSTIIHDNVSYWIASITKTDDFEYLQYFLSVNIMTANGMSSMILKYRNEDSRNDDRLGLMDWLERMK